MLMNVLEKYWSSSFFAGLWTEPQPLINVNLKKKERFHRDLWKILVDNIRPPAQLILTEFSEMFSQSDTRVISKINKTS